MDPGEVGGHVVGYLGHVDVVGLGVLVELLLPVNRGRFAEVQVELVCGR